MAHMTPTQDLIGTAEAARILNRSGQTIYRLVRDGKLTPVLTAPGGPHGVYLFDRADVLALNKD